MPIDEPTGALDVTNVSAGTDATVKFTPLLAFPLTVTATLPVVAPTGTGTTIRVEFQKVGLPGVPLKATVLLPCVVPKLAP